MSLVGGVVYLVGHFKQITPTQLEEMESAV
jgi:hypothetical protein